MVGLPALPHFVPPFTFGGTMALDELAEVAKFVEVGIDSAVVGEADVVEVAMHPLLGHVEVSDVLRESPGKVGRYDTTDILIARGEEKVDADVVGVSFKLLIGVVGYIGGAIDKVGLIGDERLYRGDIAAHLQL